MKLWSYDYGFCRAAKRWKWHDGESGQDNLTFLFSAVQKRLNPRQDRDRKGRSNIIYISKTRPLLHLTPVFTSRSSQAHQISRQGFLGFNIPTSRNLLIRLQESNLILEISLNICPKNPINQPTDRPTNQPGQRKRDAYVYSPDYNTSMPPLLLRSTSPHSADTALIDPPHHRSRPTRPYSSYCNRSSWHSRSRWPANCPSSTRGHTRRQPTYTCSAPPAPDMPRCSCRRSPARWSARADCRYRRRSCSTCNCPPTARSPGRG